MEDKDNKIVQDPDTRAHPRDDSGETGARYSDGQYRPSGSLFPPDDKGPRFSRRFKPKRRRSRAPVIVAIVVFGLFAIMLAAFLSNYSISIKSSGGSFEISIIQKSGSDGDSDGGSLDGTGVTPSTSQDAASTGQNASVSSSVVGDGTTLNINEVATGSSSGSITLTFQQIYKKVIPSVVSIITTTQSETSSGTGIIMSENGYLITNYHVVEDGTSIQVTLQDDTTYKATLVGADPQSDLAVLKINATGLTVAEFGSSDSLEVGDTVLAIGNPLGTDLKGTLTDGIISAINRDIDVGGRSMTFLQTNAALNSGNSGGPLINLYGQVIGINTMKISSYYSSVEGLGFAIPISTAKPIIDELIEKGYITGRPSLGMELSDIPDQAALFYQVPQGVYVESVDKDSDAYSKGIVSGDIIIAVNDVDVSSVSEVNALKNNRSVGDTVTLTIYRDEQTFDVSIVLMEEGKVT